MHVEVHGPIAVGHRRWRASAGAMTTIVARVAFDLRHGTSPLRSTAPALATDDLFRDLGCGKQVLWDPSDLAPRKRASDVVVVGHAYAPRPSDEIAVRLVVGEIDKALVVTGPRRFSPSGDPLAPEPTVRARMDYGVAASDLDSWNTLGIRGDRPDLTGHSAAPQVLAFGQVLGRRGDYVPPAGFGPIPPSWAPRRERLPTTAAEWLRDTAQAEPYLPDTMDLSFFQVAPVDQRIARPIARDERLVLECLHPEIPRLVTNLAAVTLHAAVSRGGNHLPLALVADTLVIDTDAQTLKITYRASVPSAEIEGSVVHVWLEGAPVADLREAPELLDAAFETAPGGEVRSERIPFQEIDPSAAPSRPPLPAREAPPSAALIDHLMSGTIAAAPGQIGAVIPFANAPLAGPPPPTAGAYAPVPPAVQHEGTPKVVAAPKVVAPAIVNAPVSLPVSAPPLMPAVAAPVAPPPVRAEPGWVPTAPVTRVEPERIDTFRLHEQASQKRADVTPGADVLASPEAPSGRAPATATAQAVAVEPVWYESVAEIEQAMSSRSLREQLDDDDDDEWLSPGEATGGAIERARRSAWRALAHARPFELTELQRHLVAHLEKGGGDRLFLVVAGELSWVLEPRESLRAWVSLAEALKADPRVKEAAEQGERALGEHHVALADVLVVAVDRLRDAVRNVTKLIGQTPIEGVVERHLIEQRAFVRRAVWSDQRLAAHLTARGTRWAVPAYFVTAAAHEAPLMQRFNGRFLAEVRTRQDPTEQAPVALRVVAFGLDVPRAG